MAGSEKKDTKIVKKMEKVESTKWKNYKRTEKETVKTEKKRKKKNCRQKGNVLQINENTEGICDIAADSSVVLNNWTE